MVDFFMYLGEKNSHFRIVFFIKFSLIVILFLLFLIVSSCNKIEPLDTHFFKAEKRLNETELLKLRRIEEDSLIEYIDFHLPDDFWRMGIDSYKEIDSLFSFEGASETRNTRLIFGVAFYYKLNNKKINYQNIFREVEAYTNQLENRKIKYREEYRQKINEIAKFNFEKFNFGDTLRIPYTYSEIEENIKTAVYVGEYFDGNPDEDSLVVYGILLNKHYFNIEKPIQSVLYEIEIKIVSLSKENPFILMRKVKLGDTLTVDLNEYGRIIRKEYSVLPQKPPN